MIDSKHIRLSPEVETALSEGAPVIALESTIISHGMPYPENLETALGCEQMARENGAVPATIAILDGELCVGLTREQLERLAKKGHAVIKASRRDIPVLVARREDGATTVAATMIIAAMAGIRVFATGGIGGVHRGATDTMDISADLDELAKTPVTVVCAGAKSILDLKLTLEYLETKGVPVIGYQTDELPAFYTRSSGLSLEARCDTPKELSTLVKAHAELGYNGGMVVMNPIPEEYSMDAGYINSVIDKAVQEAEAKGIHGKEVTPFLLAAVKDATKGKSLEANIKLVYNNVALAAQIASGI